MIQFLKKYKAFLFGFIIIVPIFYLLSYIGIIILPKEKSYGIIIYAIIWGFIIALPIHHFKKNKKIVVRVLSLLLLFSMTLFIDAKMQMPDNPITFLLLMVFWFGIAYVLFPSFIKKYWKLITFFYVPLLLHFIYLRLSSGDLEAYLKIKSEYPLYIFFLPIPILFLVWVHSIQLQWPILVFYAYQLD